jgi:hypothetical protein
MRAITSVDFIAWLEEVRDVLASTNIDVPDWQAKWPYDFTRAFDAGLSSRDAALHANKWWWWQQNKEIRQECDRNVNCWLTRGHQGSCELL